MRARTHTHTHTYGIWISCLLSISVPGLRQRLNYKKIWSTLNHLKGLEVKWVAQSCPTLCDPMDCSLPGSSFHGIFQARVLEWVAIFFSRGSSRPRDRTWVSRILDRRFTIWATREAPKGLEKVLKTVLKSLSKKKKKRDLYSFFFW